MSRCIECGAEMDPCDAMEFYECPKCRRGSRSKVPTAYSRQLSRPGEARDPRLTAEMDVREMLDLEEYEKPMKRRGLSPCPDCGSRRTPQWIAPPVVGGERSPSDSRIESACLLPGAGLPEGRKGDAKWQPKLIFEPN